jgi:hypothetical protein
LCDGETRWNLFGNKDDGTLRLCKSCEEKIANDDYEMYEEQEEILFAEDIYSYYEFIIDNLSEQ